MYIVCMNIMKYKKSLINVVVDGRVYSTEAHDRGMGRYLTFIISLLHDQGFTITLLVYQNDKLSQDDIVYKYAKNVVYLDVDPNNLSTIDVHDFSVLLEKKLIEFGADIYLDGTPAVPPMRYDITVCPVIVIAYDLIPLRNPEKYFPKGSPSIINEIYSFFLRSLIRADKVIAISNFTSNCIQSYLGISVDKIEVIYPNLDNSYRLKSKLKLKEKNNHSRVISIVGHHHSKNPEFGLRFLNTLKKDYGINTSIIVPTKTQYLALKTYKDELIKDLDSKVSVIETEKKSLFTKSTALLHSSLEEGFGIPMLESLFLNTRVIGLDISMNREILGVAKGHEHIGFLIQNMDEPNFDEIVDFILKPYDSDTYSAFDEVRDYFIEHWDAISHKLLSRTIEQSIQHYKKSSPAACMVTGLPKKFCGVSDYATSIVEGSPSNIQIYTADSQSSIINNNVNKTILKSYKSFEYDLESSDLLSKKTTIYHLAISEQLMFGIELMRKNAKKGDVIIIHDHLYLFGIYSVFLKQNRLNYFLNNYFLGEDSELVKGFPTERVLGFKEFNILTKGFRHCWLARTQATFINHLTEEAENNFVSPTILPLTKSVKSKRVPIGISERLKYSLSRQARTFRNSRRILKNDCVIGVFGSVTSNKYLIESASAVARLVKANLDLGKSKNIYFLVCGVIHEPKIMEEMRLRFIERGIQHSMIHLAPSSEDTFDSMICATDIVLCLRKQDRGQLSHIIPRALSLSSCILTNSDSGYSMISDEATFNIKDDFASIIKDYVENPEKINEQRKINRLAFEKNYNSKKMFKAILES